MKTALALMALIMFPLIALAQIVLPETVEASIDYAALLGELIANPKAFLSVAGGALLVYLSVQFLKSDLSKKYFKNLTDAKKFALITVLGQIYAFVVVVFVVKDQELSKFLVGLFSSGGAAAIFAAVKLLIGKQEA